MAKRFQQVKKILGQILEAEEERRPGLLDELCSGDDSLRIEVEALLGYDKDARRLSLSPDIEVASVESELPLEDLEGFCILGELGRGGMGVVYEAEQSQPRRRVAIKFFRPDRLSERARLRFDIEAEALGRLTHPSIARLYSVGTLNRDGVSWPYFVMERIEGETITDFADRRRTSLRNLAQLLLGTCEGIEHAHRSGVLHRDLKPDNVLVDKEGSPKILDFGVARILDEEIRETLETQGDQILGSLDYMSPEQAGAQQGIIDTRCDVFALGAIGFELAAGHRFRDLEGLSLSAALRDIAEAAAPPLRSVADRVDRDYATIIDKALALEPSARYSSVAELADDLRRYLAGEAIEARPASLGYRFRKFTRRNPVLVGTIALLFLSLVAGIITTSSQVRRARSAERDAKNERALALAETEVAKETVRVLREDVFAAAHPDRLGPQATARQLLDSAVERLDGAYGDRPDIAGAVRSTLAESLLGLGMNPQALNQVELALEATRKHLGSGSPREAELLVVKAEALELTGKVDEAMHALKEAFELLDEATPSRALADAYQTRGWLLRQNSELAAAEEAMRQALETRQKIPGISELDLAVSYNDLGIIKTDLGELDAAGQLLESALGHRIQALGRLHSSVAQSLNNLGTLHLRARQNHKAEARLRETIEVWEGLGVGDHPKVLATLANLAMAGDEDPNEGIILHRRALEMAERLGPQGRRIAAMSRCSIGSLEVKLGKVDEGLAMLRTGIDELSSIFGPDHIRVGTQLSSLGFSLQTLKRYEESIPPLRRTLEIQNKRLPPKHSRIFNTRAVLALSLIEISQTDEAQQLLKLSENDLSALSPDIREYSMTLSALSRLHDELGNKEKAAQYRQRSREARTKN